MTEYQSSAALTKFSSIINNSIIMDFIIHL
jgi:hypothetical protein